MKRQFESQHQKIIFEFANFHPLLKWMFAIPNGGFRNPKEAYNLKLQGVKAGVSDIFLPLPRGGYHGLFIELKVGENKPTKLQNEFINYANQNGYYATVAFGAQNAIDIIESYIKCR